MFYYKLFCVLLVLFFCSCGQILNSIAEETANEVRNRNSEEFAYNEKPIAIDTVTFLERKKIGEDSFYLVRSYFLTGKPYYDCWYKNNRPHGLSVFYFPSGKIQYSLEYKDGRNYSIMNSFDLKGQKNEGGSLKNGSGNLKIYHPITGELIFHTQFHKGLRNGRSFSYYSDSKKKAEFQFVNDTVFGEYFKYYHSGNIMSKGNINLREITGVVEDYYENGKLQKYDEMKNGKQIAVKEYDENGFLITEKSIIDNKLIGTKCYYSTEGILLSKGQTYNDLKHGNYDYFYPSGKIKTKEVYRNDTMLFETIWNENGKISVQNVFKDGLKSGICKEYYSTGNIKVEQNYLAGIKEGSYKSYFNNGTIYNDGTFKNDELSGDLKFYSENGKLKSIKKYN